MHFCVAYLVDVCEADELGLAARVLEVDVFRLPIFSRAFYASLSRTADVCVATLEA